MKKKTTSVDYKELMREICEAINSGGDGNLDAGAEWDSSTIEGVAEIVGRACEVVGKGKKARIKMAPSKPVGFIIYSEGGQVTGARSDVEGVSGEVFDVDDKLAANIHRDDIEAEWKKITEEYPNIVF